MTGIYTENNLKSLTKPRIIDLFLKISTISYLTNGIRNSNANIKRLESDLEVCKKRIMPL